MAEQDPESGRSGDHGQETQGDSGTEQHADHPEKKRRRRWIIAGVVAALLVGGLLYWWHSTYYEDTDDAQIDGHIVQLSARISGHVVSVPVSENQYVAAGDVIAEIDPKDYDVLVRQDEASLEAAEANYESANVGIPLSSVQSTSGISSAQANVEAANAQVKRAIGQQQQAQAEVLQAEANNQKSQQDLQRYTTLVQKDVISRQQYDQAVAAARAGDAAVNSAKANALAAADQVNVAKHQVAVAEAQASNAASGPQQVKVQKAKADQAAAQVVQARAALAQAQLNLSYTRITAPVNGIITKKSVEVGQNVSIGQNMATLVSLDDLWVTANFKETQLHLMQIGQPVKIHVDLNKREYDGKVTQIGGATGSVLSLFPPENATGNYVKVVQRVPVRIDFTNTQQNKDHRLRPGLSVEPTVRVKQ